MADVAFREGQTGAIKDFTLKNGTVVADLTGVTTVTFRLKASDGTLYAYTTVTVLSPATDGNVRYTQGATDLLAAKSPFSAYFEVIASGGVVQDFPDSRDMTVVSLPKYV